MNKKDVLGLRSLPGITGKMESTPHGFPVLEMLKFRHSTRTGTAGSFGVSAVSDYRPK